MQGYVARVGLGITLIKNQIIEPVPNKINTIFDQRLVLKKSEIFIDLNL